MLQAEAATILKKGHTFTPKDFQASMGELSWNALKQSSERANGYYEYCQTCETNSGRACS